MNWQEELTDCNATGGHETPFYIVWSHYDDLKIGVSVASG